MIPSIVALAESLSILYLAKAGVVYTHPTTG
jgi:hypothetical protein